MSLERTVTTMAGNTSSGGKDKRNSRVVCVSRKGLLMYEVSGEFPDEVVSKTPMWRLTRITPFLCK